jgi:hypothetical protein
VFWAVVVLTVVALERKITIQAADLALQTRGSQKPLGASRFNFNRIHKQKLDRFGPMGGNILNTDSRLQR